MLGLISIYVKRLAIFMIFSSFIGILMPNNEYRGYIKLIMGIILILIMLQPIKNIVTNYDDMVFFKEYELNKEIAKEELEIYEDKQTEMILIQFEKKLKEQISLLLSDYGQVKSVEVKVDNTEGDIVLGVINLDMEAYNVENTSINEMKKILSDFYKLDEANINITIQEIRS